jgi:hypothetical protein
MEEMRNIGLTQALNKVQDAQNGDFMNCIKAARCIAYRAEAWRDKKIEDAQEQ